jgi:FMN phosphatase YigB (HAD superfamily)
MRCILCDFDGVLCKLDRSKAEALLNTYEPYLLTSAGDLLDRYFFTNPYFRQIDEGSITYQCMLKSIISDCWSGQLEPWLEVWNGIWSCYSTDMELLSWLIDRADEGIAVRIITDNHREFRTWFSSRSEFLAFQGPNTLICSGEIGCCKPSREIFDRALIGLGLTMQDVCYIDDSPRNIKEAKKLGMTAVHHVDTTTTIAALSRLGD